MAQKKSKYFLSTVKETRFLTTTECNFWCFFGSFFQKMKYKKDIFQKYERNWKVNGMLGDTNKLLLIFLCTVTPPCLGSKKNNPCFLEVQSM